MKQPVSAGPPTANDLADAPARNRAVSDFHHNLVVLAGAGTGKTSLLVERALLALATGSVEPTQLAAITFTEKAAAELLHRLAAELDGLRRLAQGSPAAYSLTSAPTAAARVWSRLSQAGEISAEKVAAHALGALDQLERMTVTTIHGFCAELLRAHPLEAGIDPGFTIDPGEHLEVLLDDEWDRFLLDELAECAPRASLWQGILETLPLPEVEAAARLLAGFGFPQDLLTDPPLVTSREFFGAECEKHLASAHAILARENDLTEKTTTQWILFLKALEAHQEEGAAGVRACIAAKPDLAKRLEGTAVHGNRVKGAFSDQLKKEGAAVSAFLKKVRPIDDQLCRDVLLALAPFACQVRKATLARSQVGFDGLLVLARDLLANHPEVREKLRQRYRMLMVDEFQDTDPVQYEIVLLLAEAAGSSIPETGKTTSTDAYEVRLAPGKLFIVGDAKQSIYRFRGADFAAFSRAVDRIIAEGGAALDLTANFRSLPGVIESINLLFSRPQTWSPSAYQPDYVPITAVKPAAIGAPPGAEIWTVAPGGKDSAPARRRAEAQVLAREIRALADGGTPLGSITLLFRAFTNLHIYLRPLRQYGIPYVVDGGKDFLDRPEVTHLLALLRTLSHPSDQVALLAFLRSPAGAVADGELAAYAAARGRWDWRRHLDGEAQRAFPELARAFTLLRQLSATTRDLPADRVIARVLEESPLLPLEAAAYEGAQRVANLRKLAESAAAMARDGTLSLGEVLDRITTVRQADMEGDSPLDDDSTEAVKILTIHKAKGLENDIIIVPDLARQDSNFTPRTEARLIRLADGRPSIALKVDRKVSAAHAWAAGEHKNHETAEETRVLYVALTRARHRLIVVAAGDTKTTWLKTLSAWGYDCKRPPADGAALAAGIVLHRHLSPSGPPAPGPAQDVAPLAAAVHAHQRALTKLQQSAVSLFEHPSGASDRDHDPGMVGSQPPGRGQEPDIARDIGLVVHHLLEHWAGHAAAGPASLLEQVAGAAQRIAGTQAGNTAAVARGARGVLERFIASPLAARLGAVEVLGREVPMLLRDESGRRWRGSIDLLYREPGGAVAVADYKTDEGDDDAALSERYRLQLTVYAEAVRRALELPAAPRMELWLLRHGRILTLPPLP